MHMPAHWQCLLVGVCSSVHQLAMLSRLLVRYGKCNIILTVLLLCGYQGMSIAGVSRWPGLRFSCSCIVIPPVFICYACSCMVILPVFYLLCLLLRGYFANFTGVCLLLHGYPASCYMLLHGQFARLVG